MLLSIPSSDRLTKLANNLLHKKGNPVLANMEYILNFERFDKPKTCEHVSSWIAKSLREATVKDYDVSVLSADGASNAEYSDVCLAHQNERSGGFASGTICFASEPDVNKELGSIWERTMLFKFGWTTLLLD